MLTILRIDQIVRFRTETICTNSNLAVPRRFSFRYYFTTLLYIFPRIFFEETVWASACRVCFGNANKSAISEIEMILKCKFQVHMNCHRMKWEQIFEFASTLKTQNAVTVYLCYTRLQCDPNQRNSRNSRNTELIRININSTNYAHTQQFD